MSCVICCFTLCFLSFFNLFSSLVYFVIITVMNMIVLMSPSDGPAHCRMNTVLLN